MQLWSETRVARQYALTQREFKSKTSSANADIDHAVLLWHSEISTSHWNAIRYELQEYLVTESLDNGIYYI